MMDSIQVHRAPLLIFGLSTNGGKGRNGMLFDELDASLVALVPKELVEFEICWQLRDQTRGGPLLAIRSELLARPTADVDDPDIRSTGCASLVEKGQQVRVDAVVSTGFGVQMGDLVIVDSGHRR